VNTFIIPALTVALPSIGFIAGALFAGGGIREYRELLESSMLRERGLHSMIEEADEDQNALRAHNRRLDTQIEYLKDALVKANDASRYYGREIAEARALIFGYEATERARGAGWRNANDERKAAAADRRRARMEAAEQRSAMKVAAE
jgi:hypothetical protein